MKPCFRCKINKRHKGGSYCSQCNSIINHYHNHKFKPVKEILATKSKDKFVNGEIELESLKAWRDICELLFNSKDYTHYMRGQFFKEYILINQKIKLWK